mmetsp:Transcript_5305/g.8172  ORF Transcript_5305/g.8172 Transcript_5305/m.8172 type:complete len:486 (+) Transcript_5305:392-1849(+)|eukprot:CAMPEP_0203746164 /NCGR_PEP_ID=MMETSP0098-20131031/1684_1 /ASSEMBLY_ACC=CAM_ASM_000208 /TAXON_ID=96639 /ORGANISM=" , Strain NY0313808BC1" /LENGTH=485 /DNA_ID=CAMNT_0050634153 /DNA_START=351 /DNA_END=1808 /DNA_ORIENTATION=-
MASVGLPPFLAKLKTLTESCPKGVAGWNKAGTEYQITNGVRFERDVLKKHFKGSISTFVRQLHFYCFKKLEGKHPGIEWAFSHEKFKRDEPHLIFEIRRKTRTENSGPASKDEVQALRTELSKLKGEMAQMRELMVSMKSELDQVKIQQSDTATSPYGNNKPSAKSKNKRLRTDSDSDSDKGQFQGFLPFEDASHTHVLNQTSSTDSEGSDDLVKKQKVDYAEPFQMENLVDFSDLFLGLDRMDSLSTTSTSTSPRHHDSFDALPLQSMQQQQLPPDQRNNCCEVFLQSVEGLRTKMPNEVFAGFLSKFVEHTVLLNNKSMLGGELDPELEIFVHASLPKDCPFKNLLNFAIPTVRTVLVNVLSDVAASYWQCSMKCTSGLTKPTVREDFMQRPAVVFIGPNFEKSIRGECFLHFLNFLLHAAINDSPLIPTPEIDPTFSPFFRSFEKHFSPQVKRVMIITHNTIAEHKKAAGDECSRIRPENVN